MRYFVFFLICWTVVSHALLGVHVNSKVVHRVVGHTAKRIKRAGHKAIHSAAKTTREAMLMHHSNDGVEGVLRLISEARHS